MTDSVDTSSVDDLLDSTLDDLEDLPSFEPFPGGAHRVMVSLNFKEINSKPVIEITLKMLETVELSDPNGTPAKEGDECSSIFMLDNEFGRGNLKLVATPLAAAMGTASIRETVEQTKEVECMVITSIRIDKSNPDDIKKYLKIKQLEVI